MLKIKRRKVLRKPSVTCPHCEGHGYKMVDEEQNRTVKCNLCLSKGHISREEFLRYYRND